MAAGLYPRVNGDAVVGRCLRGLVGWGRLGLCCFGMGIPLKAGVIGGFRLLVGVEYCWVHL